MKVFLITFVAMALLVALEVIDEKVGDLEKRVQAQSIELATDGVKIDDLKRRVQELEDDMDRVAPYTGVVLPPRASP
jgi:hypothetical protein